MCAAQGSLFLLRLIPLNDLAQKIYAVVNGL